MNKLLKPFCWPRVVIKTAFGKDQVLFFIPEFYPDGCDGSSLLGQRFQANTAIYPCNFDWKYNEAPRHATKSVLPVSAFREDTINQAYSLSLIIQQIQNVYQINDREIVGAEVRD